MSARNRVVQGRFFHAPVRGDIDILDDALVSVGDDGRIAKVLRAGEPGYADLVESAAAEDRLLAFDDRHCILPGLVDLHVHAPQYPQLGEALDVPLEVWLDTYTFPLEARYADPDFAQASYSVLVDDLLAAGTTTALYFATIHLDATKSLADICLAKGQRALVGKVVMDHPGTCPDYYRDPDTRVALAETRDLIEYVRSHPQNREGRVLPVITPRFVPSCSDEALAGLGELAAETGCHMQTHCSESDWAHTHVAERMGMSDTESLDRFGLLGRRSVLAHSNFMSDGDFAIMAGRGSAVAHCALSNAYFAGSVFPLRRALERNVRVGLGTDISGGPAHSMFEATRMTIQAARMLESGVDPNRPAHERGVPDSRIDFATAFHLATAGGGDALDLLIGTFEPGRYFDALVIDTQAKDGTIRIFDSTSAENMLHKTVYVASKPNIKHVFVNGERVAGWALTR